MLYRIEKTVNYYDSESELSQVNRIASIQPVSISRLLYTMISFCLKHHEETLGCFDITINSDNYNQDTIHSICLSAEENTLFFRKKGITIDLSGFAKGHALEKIREILQVHRIENALINMGNSSVLAMGNHPHGKGWKVDFGNQANIAESIQNPTLFLHDECLTTSGNDTPTRKHIVSPHSGNLIDGVKQVAVVTDDGAVGEILSTCLFVANQEQRDILIKRFRLKTVIDL